MDVECPVCSLKFKNDVINSHLDKCLEKTESSHNASKRSSGETSNFFEAKKIKSNSVDNLPKSVSENGNLCQKSFLDFEKKPKNFLPSPKTSHSIDDKTPSKLFAPLADQMRPNSLNEYSGQEHVLGEECILRKLIEKNEIPSMIFWGPPGCDNFGPYNCKKKSRI
ncbi:ATPase WRNIP1 homolog C26H5.02c-like [Centruroides sculpturatus]|uniref:ATPase WRNIP1 homolog C26H5.02c-like n=1 Tax=Centruroides sculpturatus TaxID=218467 RepID=UPI000C6E8D2A|nr:ATPase WRNIP1 homolog C26H5.02c-like [Centruroides sculpturatus]